jgi:hypothetical protein
MSDNILFSDPNEDELSAADALEYELAPGVDMPNLIQEQTCLPAMQPNMSPSPGTSSSASKPPLPVVPPEIRHFVLFWKFSRSSGEF